MSVMLIISRCTAGEVDSRVLSVMTEDMKASIRTFKPATGSTDKNLGFTWIKLAKPTNPLSKAIAQVAFGYELDSSDPVPTKHMSDSLYGAVEVGFERSGAKSNNPAEIEDKVMLYPSELAQVRALDELRSDIVSAAQLAGAREMQSIGPSDKRWFRDVHVLWSKAPPDARDVPLTVGAPPPAYGRAPDDVSNVKSQFCALFFSITCSSPVGVS